MRCDVMRCGVAGIWRRNAFWEDEGKGRKRDDACIREQLERFFLFISVHLDRLNAGEKKRCELSMQLMKSTSKKEIQGKTATGGTLLLLLLLLENTTDGGAWLLYSSEAGRGKEQATGIGLYAAVELKNGRRREKKRQRNL